MRNVRGRGYEKRRKTNGSLENTYGEENNSRSLLFGSTILTGFGEISRVVSKR